MFDVWDIRTITPYELTQTALILSRLNFHFLVPEAWWTFKAWEDLW